jgi:hypothetical protein
VKVGIVDTGVDLDRPELQTALDLTGATVPKIYDWTTKTQPRLTDSANGDPTWVPLTAVTVNDNGQNLDTSAGNYQLPDALKGTAHALSSASSSRAIRASAASSGATSTVTATRATRSASSRTRRPAPCGSTPTRTTISSTTRR